MPHKNIINAPSEDEVWKIIREQLESKNDSFDYTAQFATDKSCITLDIDLNPDRDDEEDDPLTSFTADLPEDISFRFNVKKQGFKHQIGKLFGMQDVIIGHDVFDRKFIIQSNDETKVKEILSHADISHVLLDHPVVEFKIRERRIGTNIEIVLTLDLEGQITDAGQLRNIYQPFKLVLNKLDF